VAEERLSLAEQLWDLRMQLCPAQPSSSNATALIMRKLQETR
jgi:hypothetical protein